jgi:hypothetical protein
MESLSMLDPHLVSGTLATKGLSDQVYNLQVLGHSVEGYLEGTVGY